MNTGDEKVDDDVAAANAEGKKVIEDKKVDDAVNAANAEVSASAPSVASLEEEIDAAIAKANREAAEKSTVTGGKAGAGIPEGFEKVPIMVRQQRKGALDQFVKQYGLRKKAVA